MLLFHTWKYLVAWLSYCLPSQQNGPEAPVNFYSLLRTTQIYAIAIINGQ